MNRPSIATVAALIAALACSGCGKQVALKAKPGTPPVPTAAFASQPESAEALMQPTTQARPLRNVDMLSRSEERKVDPFDLPPGPDNGK